MGSVENMLSFLPAEELRLLSMILGSRYSELVKLKIQQEESFKR